MTKTVMQRTLSVMMMAALGAATVMAQGTQTAPPAQPPAAAPKPPEKPIIPLKVQLTLSRSDGDKKVTNLPFTVWVNANSGNTSLDVGSQVPVPGSAPGTVQYRSVGTSINCSATSMDDGRFRLQLVINDSSVVPTKDKDSGTPPTFQSFSAQNLMLLRDGQSAQFVAATDKVSGEVTRVDMTLTVIK